MAALKAEIEALKRDYIQVLQSSISVPTGDVIDGTAVTLYGGSAVCTTTCLLFARAQLLHVLGLL